MPAQTSRAAGNGVRTAELGTYRRCRDSLEIRFHSSVTENRDGTETADRSPLLTPYVDAVKTGLRTVAELQKRNRAQQNFVKHLASAMQQNWRQLQLMPTDTRRAFIATVALRHALSLGSQAAQGSGVGHGEGRQGERWRGSYCSLSAARTQVETADTVHTLRSHAYSRPGLHSTCSSPRSKMAQDQVRLGLRAQARRVQDFAQWAGQVVGDESIQRWNSCLDMADEYEAFGNAVQFMMAELGDGTLLCRLADALFPSQCFSSPPSDVVCAAAAAPHADNDANFHCFRDRAVHFGLDKQQLQDLCAAAHSDTVQKDPLKLVEALLLLRDVRSRQR